MTRNLIRQREAHYAKFLGALDQKIMHSTDEKAVHVDIYTFAPTAERPFYTLITGGMSDLRQRVPSEWQIALRAEIMLYASEPKRWMYGALKKLAEMPSDEDTFLSYRHTVPNGMPVTKEPSLLTGYFFAPPIFVPDEFSPMNVDGDLTDILLMIPITEAEREFATCQGSSALLQLFSDSELDPVIEEHRSCLVSGAASPGAP